LRERIRRDQRVSYPLRKPCLKDSQYPKTKILGVMQM
jgi:hypothetical protein